MEHGAATRRQQIIALLRGRPWEAGELSRALGISGSVSKVEMIPLHCPSKGIAVDKQANDEVVHLCGFREANGLTDQAFNARPQGQMRALDLLRILFAWAVDSGVEMTRVGTPIIRIIACDPKGFQQGF